MSRRIKCQVNYIVEVTSAIGLKDAPPVFPKGFKQLLNTFGETKINYHMAVPFIGQHSLFVTSSADLGGKVNSFISENNCYQVASMDTNVDVSINWFDAVRNFNVALIMCCLKSVARAQTIVASAGKSKFRDYSISFHNSQKMHDPDQDHDPTFAGSASPPSVVVIEDDSIVNSVKEKGGNIQ